jgi:diguanylate cyclase (GGDEF)-like protein
MPRNRARDAGGAGRAVTVRRVLLAAYVAAVVGAGSIAGALAVAGGAPWRTVEGRPSEFALFAVLLVAGELRPLRVRRREGEEEIVTSTVFAFALLLRFGPGPAVVAQAVASAVSDLAGRKPAHKVAFNVGQYCLTLAAAGATYEALADLPFEGDVRSLPALLAAAGAYYAVNSVVIGTVIALDKWLPWAPLLREKLADELNNDVVLLGLAPIVVVVADRSLPLIPLLLLPVMAVYRSAHVSLEKEHQALHDALTGLPNRVLFRARAGFALETAARRGGSLAVMLLDLDRFKEVNDTLGHRAGDLLLQAVGPRIRSVAGVDVLSRFGGDEFAMVASGVGPEEAIAVASRIVAALERPFVVDGFKLDIEASIGIALFPDHGDDVDTLLQRADVAMYVAKSSHSGYELYNGERDHNSRRRLSLLGELREAMGERELVLHYQPKASLADGEIVGAEALVRWRHPRFGLVLPSEFVPVAEHTGLIRPLTYYVLNEALAQVRLWLDRGILLPVAVNLSVRSLHDLQAAEQIGELLARWDVPGRLLQLEITEGTIMADPVRARRVLAALDAMGIGIAIDDFGTGYSSLSYLRDLPVREIKVDRSFVARMVDDPSDLAIVRSTVDLGRNLGLRVVAEGVEDQATWALLHALGCEVAQGFYISPPLAAERLEVLLATRRDLGAGGTVRPSRPAGLPGVAGDGRRPRVAP